MRSPVPIEDFARRRGERGLAMVTLLATVMLVTMISLSLIGLMYADITHASIQYAVTRSFYIAQAGLAQAKAQLSGAADPAAYTTPDAGVTVPFGDGRFTYWVDAGPATGCGPGFKTLDAVGEVAYHGRTFPRRVRACAAPGAPFLAALFGVASVQFQGNSRTYLAPYFAGTPGRGGSVGSFSEIKFSGNDVRINALSEDSSETLALRDGTFFDYALFGFSKRPDYTANPTDDPEPWILSVFGDLVKAQAANRQVPTPCGSPYACITVGDNITDLQNVTELRKAMYLRHVYMNSFRKEIVPPLELNPEAFRALAAQNSANAVVNSAAGLPGKGDSVYTTQQFTRIVLYLLRHPDQFLQGTVYIDGSLQLLRRINLGGNAGNVTLAVRGDLVIRSTAVVTNRHDLSTVPGRQAPGILVFGAPHPSLLARSVCGVEINGSGRLVTCRGGTLIADGLIYTEDGMSVRPKAFVDEIGAMYHNNRGTSHPSFINDDATVVLRFDPLALSAFGTGISILSWQQLFGPDTAGPGQASPPTTVLRQSAPTGSSLSSSPAPPAAAAGPPPAAPASPPAVTPSLAAPASRPAAAPPPAAPAPPPAAPRSPAQESPRPAVAPGPTPPHGATAAEIQQAANPRSTVGGSQFHVQAGAFRNREYADDLVRRLRAHGYDVKLVEAPLIRVWVGPPMGRAAAEELAAKLQQNGFETFLTPDR